MIVRTLALAVALAFTAPAFAAHKAPQNKPRKQIVAENKDVMVNTTVNGVWGKNKKLEKIVAVATVPLAQISQTGKPGKAGKAKKKSIAILTVVEAKNGKRTISLKNIAKGSEVDSKMRLALDDAVAFYKQHHVEASSSISSSGKKKKKK